MKLVNIIEQGKEQAAILDNDSILLIEDINTKYLTNWSTTIWDLIQYKELRHLETWYAHNKFGMNSSFPVMHLQGRKTAPIISNPSKLLGIGFNYAASEEKLKDYDRAIDPVSFLKPATAIIGPDDSIRIPKQSYKTTAEAELAVVIGETCKDIEPDEAINVIAGYTSAIDVTAADIHAANHRYLMRAKSFDTFCSIGSEFITKESISNVKSLQVRTLLNGNVQHENTVSNMIYDIAYCVSFFSKVMTLHPGDIILTGTPGPAVIEDGDCIECHIEGMLPLKNKVKDMKKVPQQI